MRKVQYHVHKAVVKESRKIQKMDTLRVNNVLKRKVITASRLAGGTQVVSII